VRPEKEFDYLTPSFFDETVDTYPQCGLVVSTTGLPREFGKMKFWAKEESERPKLVLVNTPLAPIIKPLKLGVISAVVVTNPGLKKQEELAGKAPKEVFDACCLVIRAENLSEMEQAYPILFPASP